MPARAQKGGRLGNRRQAALVIALLVLLLAPAAPARAHHRVPSPQPAQLPRLPDLLSGVLAALLPAPARPINAGVEQRVAASTLRVVGQGCGPVGLIGSGFAPQPDVAVTAAHVVAGATATEVVRPDGQRLPARVVAFDSAKDLAVLRVDGLGQEPLTLGRAVPGTPAAVFGYPGGGSRLEVSPAVVEARDTARVESFDGARSSLREILRLRSRLEAGDSGAAVVDGAGSVVGVAFAVSTVRPDLAFAVSSTELQPLLERPLEAPVSTGACLR